MTWCDKLASTPGVGFTLDWQFISGGDILEALAPMFRSYAQGPDNRYSVDRLDADAAAFSTEDGFQVAVEAKRAFVNFQHRLRARPTSGGPPIMEMLSHPQPYTELLGSVFNKLSEAILLLPNATGRKIQRVGVVSTTIVSEQQLPPGIARYVRYMGRPWDGAIEEYNFNVTSMLGESKHGIDKCIHTVHKKGNQIDDENLVTVQFDWQRWFSGAHSISSGKLKELFGHAEKAALQYFEEIAEGSIFDEDIIRSASIIVDPDIPSIVVEDEA